MGFPATCKASSEFLDECPWTDKNFTIICRLRTNLSSQEPATPNHYHSASPGKPANNFGHGHCWHSKDERRQIRSSLTQFGRIDPISEASDSSKKKERRNENTADKAATLAAAELLFETTGARKGPKRRRSRRENHLVSGFKGPRRRCPTSEGTHKLIRRPTKDTATEELHLKKTYSWFKGRRR
ncbi:unnamed protein product [Caenorhabditis auriculariae]|uniref:Uncharacterized protein n=1 Tax=Caenorhabditis auriculariae TaxID=2777116 RepID=A0A8S1HR24_9PELO|nr:unnamed protein product [Caenorhabditis auriculariae]